MTINNNNSFYYDPLTEGWTKKEWALNLLPLGGMACVAYEMGSTYLSARNQTAKISQDFFKSPFQTTFKKIAQCLWIPIVICGALKLLCFIVTACWDWCFPPVHHRLRQEGQVLHPIAQDLCEIIPDKVFVNSFSYLNLHELGICRRINKSWNTWASMPAFWKAAVYREMAFSSKNWAQWDADLVKDVDLAQEISSLPTNIAEELRHSAFPGKRIRETHVLVRMPKGFTLKKLGELAKKFFPKNAGGYKYIKQQIMKKLGDKPADESV